MGGSDTRMAASMRAHPSGAPSPNPPTLCNHPVQRGGAAEAPWMMIDRH